MYSIDLQRKTNGLLFTVITTIIVAFLINIVSNQISSYQEPDSTIPKFVFLIISLLIITSFLILANLVFNYNIENRSKNITSILIINSNNGNLTDFPQIYTQMIMRQTLNVIYDYRQNVLFRLSPSIRIGDSKNLNYRIRERILGRTDDNILLDIASSLILDQLFMHVRLLNKAKSIDENSDVFNELKKNSIFSNLIEIVRDRGIPNNTLNSILQPCIPQGFKLKTKLVNPSYKNNERIILENRWIRLTIDYHVGLETQIRKFGRKYYPLVGDIPIESSQMDKAYELFQMEHLRLITLNYNVELRLKMGRVFFALITFIRGKFRTENLEFVKQLESIYEFLENNFHGSINYDLVEEHSNASDKYLLDTLKKVNDRLAEAQKSTKEKI